MQYLQEMWETLTASPAAMFTMLFALAFVFVQFVNNFRKPAGPAE